MQPTAKYWVLAKRIKGVPKVSDFLLVKEKLRELEDGEILVKAEFLSIDGYVRDVVIPKLPIGSQLPCCQFAKVYATRNKDFEPGERLMGHFGWRTWTIVNPKGAADSCMGIRRISELPELKDEMPETYYLGCLGICGMTAYYGMLEGCKPVGGDTLVVTAAGGVVGSLAGQIARIKGARVIAISGNSEHVKWLKRDLHYPGVINYKQTRDIGQAVEEIAPEGVDCFFDTVGGPIAFGVMKHMSEFGRVAQIGSLARTQSKYSGAAPAVDAIDFVNIRRKSVRIEGFAPCRWIGKEKEDEAIKQLMDWIFKKKIVVHENIVEDFMKMPQVFIDMLEGKRKGKYIIKTAVTKTYD